MLYLWRLRQSTATGYDTYDSAVVVASTEEEARKIHPSKYQNNDGDWKEGMGDWPKSWEQVEAEKLGPLGNTDFAAGAVVCASFNAG